MSDMNRTAEPTAAEIAEAVDPVFARAFERAVSPGLAYGVVRDGVVLHARGLGVGTLGGAAPTSETVFRIASMTKSVTAATVLSLRDDGLLTLDLPAADLVPELLAGGAVARLVTLRHLLTMTAGFPTDDPWGDRQQDLPHDGLRRLLASGLAPAWRPGERFEYSNLGYAILGLAIEAVTHQPYSEAASMRVLRPVGMSSTGYHPEALDPARLARGYVHRSTGWVEEPPAGYGAFAPMGGLFSTVGDLARWVGVLQRADSAASGGADLGAALGLLSPTSLREMQRTQRPVSANNVEGEPAPELVGYGFGLFEEVRAWGRTVHHSGGYPGFGSHMRWHPASGLGIVALANGTYAPVYAAARDALRQLVVDLDLPRQAPPPPFPALERASAAVTAWLDASDPDGDEGEALRALCADNVERDVPWAERLAQWRQVQSATGGASVEVPGTRRRPSPASTSWEVEGSAGRARLTVMLAPHDLSLLQALTLRPLSGAVAAAVADDEESTPPAATTEWW